MGDREASYPTNDPARANYALYLDTSALLKLYVAEDGTDTVEAAVESAYEVHTSAIAYLEARVGLVRIWREGKLDDEELDEAVGNIDADWETYVIWPYSYSLAERAAKLASKHEGLRSYDALHLATSLEVAEERQTERETLMLAYDRKLVRVSRHEVTLYHNPYAQEEAAEE